MPQPFGPYRPIVAAGGWLITAGQLGLQEGKLVSGGIRAEVTQAIANIEDLLRDQGSGLDDVVKTTVFIRHMRDYPLMNEAYTEAFGDNRPARSAVAVGELPLHALVEIEAWAWPAGND